MFQNSPLPDPEVHRIAINKKALYALARAQQEGETASDIIVRLSLPRVASLQRRGEKEIATSDGRELIVRIDQDKCAGAESCVVTAPSVFALDPTQLGVFKRGSQPLGMKEVGHESVDSETIIIAAKSCPYRAIYLRDKTTGEELAGGP